MKRISLLVAMVFVAGAMNSVGSSAEELPGRMQSADRRGAIGAQPIAEPAAPAFPEGQVPQAAPDPDLAAFQEALRGTLPLGPGQVRSFRDQAVAVRRQVNAGPLKLVTRSEAISLSPGHTPSRVRVGPRHVSSIAFLDSTGAPWPVSAAVVGAPDLFSVMQPAASAETAAAHILTISALEYSGASSLNVVLEGAPLPLTLSLTVDAETADGTLSLRLDRTGPRATPPLLSPQGEAAASEVLMAFLDGTPPKGARRLRFRGPGAGVQVWGFDGRAYLRTRDSLAWPAWIASVRSGDGATTVYELSPSEALILSEHGGLTRYRLMDEGEL